jgi:hypothetical protein
MAVTYRHSIHALRGSNTAISGTDDHRRRGITRNTLQNRKGLTSWHDALAGLQAILRRARADPDFSQRSIFNFCAPLVSFGYLLALSAVLFRWPQAHAAFLSVMNDIGRHKFVLAKTVAILAFGLFGVVASLRVLIGMIAYGVGMFVEKDIGSLKGVEGKEDSGSVELSGMDLLFGGIFT